MQLLHQATAIFASLHGREKAKTLLHAQMDVAFNVAFDVAIDVAFDEIEYSIQQ